MFQHEYSRAGRSFQRTRGRHGNYNGESLWRNWLVFVSLAVIFLGGCASETFAPENAPEYAIIREATPFYRLGPQQARGPTLLLRMQTRVKLLRREMGFSLVQLADLKTGYVANENMAIAPPQKVASLSDVSKPAPPKRSRGHSGEVFSDPSVDNDSEVDQAIPPPDFSIGSEVVPDVIPLPDETPVEKPSFRY